ncbi:MAG: ADP compounds hydrolase NudE, partial [Gammaproteobacteria bacterium]
MTVPKKPDCLQLTTVARSRLFTIEQMQLRFSNGAERVFERIKSGPKKAVLVIPVLDDNTILLIREYAAGIDRYEISFPKG